jgi:uncharacterized protein YqgV (UPF0045/DUF77 family)
LSENQIFFTAEISITSTQIESNNLDNILEAIKISHMTLRNIGIERIISSIRIDE